MAADLMRFLIDKSLKIKIISNSEKIFLPENHDQCIQLQ